MQKLLAICAVLLLVSCATVYVSPDATLKKGATIQMASMSRDPLGGAARLTAALEQRGFIVLSGEIGKNVTNNTPQGTESFRPTSATHYVTFTYTTADDHASCSLMSLQTKRTEVMFEITPLTPSAATSCAEAILRAAK